MVEVTDIRGTKHYFPETPERCVSLVPSLTETVINLDCPERICGCTQYCLEADGLGDVAVIGGASDPDIDAIRSLNPDLVLAGREENRKEDVIKIEEFCRVYVCEPRTVEDVDKLLSDLCLILDKQAEYPAWSEKLLSGRKNLNLIRAEKKFLKFVYLVWWDPPIIAGGQTYISGMLSEGPFQNAFHDIPRYPEISLNEITDRDVDIIFASSEPYNFNEDLISRIKHAADGIRVEKIDGKMCGWYGTRTIRGLEYLRGLSSRLAEY